MAELHIDINNFTEKFSEYSSDFLEFVAKHNIKAPKIDTNAGQGIALLTHEDNRGKYALRDDLEAFFESIDITTKDAIQTVNKCEQWGLKRSPIKGQYCIPFPFEYFPLNVMKRKKNIISGNKDDIVNATKEFIKVHYLEVPNNLWQVGHKDAYSTDNTEKNLVYQPPIQGKYRDKYKFDDLGLTKFPSGKELCSNISKYYSKEEQELILQTLLANKNNSNPTTKPETS